MSSSQNERTLGGDLCSKTNKDKQEARGSKLGNLERTYFLNVPIEYHWEWLTLKGAPSTKRNGFH